MQKIIKISYEIYELGHYLADNILGKSCMVVLAEKNRKDLIYKNDKSKYTHDFPELYESIRKLFYPELIEYKLLVKDFHTERNVYQHKFESLQFTIRQTEAEKYVDFVIAFMKTTGILGKNEVLPNIILTSKQIIYKNYETNRKQTIYQEFYNLLNDLNRKNFIIELHNILDNKLINYLKTDLVMEYHSGSGYKILHNSDWSFEMISRFCTITNKNTNEKFSYEEPDKNRHVLNDFLEYYKNCLKEKGITIIDQIFRDENKIKNDK